MERTLWNDGWRFWQYYNDFAMAQQAPPEARPVTLPHDAMIEKPARPDSPNGTNTGYRDGGNYIYAKTLTLAEGDCRRHVLHFEGVYERAMVRVNGNHVVTCANGYSGFDADLTDYLRTGDNEVRVLVKNAGMTNSRWYSGSGIYRDVWLLRSGSVYLDPNGLHVRTESLEEDAASLLTEATVVNRSAKARELLLRCRVTDAQGRVRAEDETRIFLRAGERRTTHRRILLARPALWSETEPNLYTLRCAVVSGAQELDAMESDFGVRTLSLDAVHGLRVNGRTVKLRGACIHHDNGPLGAATLWGAERRRVRLLKAAGFNAIRMSHHPASEALLRACDREGVFVMDELTDMWNYPKSSLDYALEFTDSWREDARRMVAKDFNHPSVVLYSVGNEIPEIGNPAGSNVCAEICALLHSLDPTRYTTAGINGIFTLGDRMDEIVADVMGSQVQKGDRGDKNVNEFMAAMFQNMDKILQHRVLSEVLELATDGLDAAGYNYMTPRYEPDAEHYPNRVLVGSETYPPQIAENWALVKKLPNLIGDFTWTGWDYIGETGIGVPAYGNVGMGDFHADWPVQLAYCGDLDITGFRRPVSYWREIVYGLRKTPYAAVRDPAHFGEPRVPNPWVFSDAWSQWDWPTFVGKPVEVEVYAPGDEAELVVNGVSLGRKPLTECKTSFETVYNPGSVVAIAYEGGAETGRFTLETPGSAAGLRLRKEYEGDGLVYLEASPVDDRGRVCAGGPVELQAAVEGGELLGFGSGCYCPTHNYNEGVTDTWFGRAILIVRKTGGPVRARVRSALGDAEWTEKGETDA